MKKVILTLCIFTLLFSTVFCTVANASMFVENPEEDAPSEYIYQVPNDARDSKFWSYLVEGYYPLPYVDAYWNAYKERGGMTEKPNLIIGDVNIDGKVNAADAIFTLWYSSYTRVGDTKLYLPNNPYYLIEQPHVVGADYGPVFRTRYGGNCYSYHNPKSEKYQQEGIFNYAAEQYYRLNSVLMADTNYDGKVNAADALLILKYAVGKIDSFPRKDFSTTKDTWPMYYLPWINEDYDFTSLTWLRYNLFSEETK